MVLDMSTLHLTIHQAMDWLKGQFKPSKKPEGEKKTKGDIDVRIARFLFHYRITPHATTGQSPAQLLLKRQPRSTLDLMVTDVGSRVQKNQEHPRIMTEELRFAHLGWEMQFLCKILMALLSGLQEG